MLWLRLYSSVGLLCRALASAPATLVRALQPWHFGLQVCRGHRLSLAVGPILSAHSVACCVSGSWLRPCPGRITIQSSGCHFVAPLISSVRPLGSVGFGRFVVRRKPVHQPLPQSLHSRRFSGPACWLTATCAASGVPIARGARRHFAWLWRRVGFREGIRFQGRRPNNSFKRMPLRGPA